jgi:hypothetical protein
MEPHEFYHRRLAMSASTNTVLSRILDCYGRLLAIKGNQSLDPDPGAQSPERTAWRAGHRALHLTIGRDGCEDTARRITRSIPEALWSPGGRGMMDLPGAGWNNRPAIQSPNAGGRA